MPNITAPPLSFPSKAFPAQQAGAPTGVVGDLLFSEVMPRYATLVKQQKVFYTSAVITSMTSFVTAANTGPQLWNKPGSGIDAHILAICCANATTAAAASACGAIGWASNAQTTAPVSPTPIAAVNAYAGGGPSSLGAVSSAGTVSILPVPIFLPLIALNQAAVSINLATPNWLDLGGALIVGPGTVGYVCGSAVLTTLVIHVGIVWAELPA